MVVVGCYDIAAQKGKRNLRIDEDDHNHQSSNPEQRFTVLGHGLISRVVNYKKTK
jgi:hypothetical protein